MKFLFAPALIAPIAMLAACAAQNEPEPESAVEGEEGAVAAPESEDAGGDGLILDTDAPSGTVLIASGGSAASFDPECMITETGIAGIENPATLGDFVEAFPADTALAFQPVYMVDFGALCALSGGEDAICAIFESYDVDAYDGNIEVMAMGVYADQCRTAEGVGPGTSIADAINAYGDPRFGFSYENEAREYVSFAEAPDAYSFRAESETGGAMQVQGNRPSGRFGGDYAGVEGDSYFETATALPDARIWEIWITPLP